MSGRTCTQPLSEIATVGVGCGEVLSWYSVAGVAFGAPGKCEKKLHLVKNHYNMTLNELNKKRCYGVKLINNTQNGTRQLIASACAAYIQYMLEWQRQRVHLIYGGCSAGQISMRVTFYWVGGLRRNLLLVLLPKITIITRV